MGFCGGDGVALGDAGFTGAGPVAVGEADVPAGGLGMGSDPNPAANAE